MLYGALGRQCFTEGVRCQPLLGEALLWQKQRDMQRRHISVLYWGVFGPSSKTSASRMCLPLLGVRRWKGQAWGGCQAHDWMVQDGYLGEQQRQRQRPHGSRLEVAPG